MEKPIKVRLHILSPLHIGCGDVYEPTNFLIDDKLGKLIEFDSVDFIKSLSSQERERFINICKQGTIASIINLYKFISGKRVKGREVEIALDLKNHYKKVRDISSYSEKSIKEELNKFTINKTAYNPHDDLPYIPGSSLKGALRTAYLSKLAKEKGIRNIWESSRLPERQQARELEGKLLLGYLETDPFRMVKISDFLPLAATKTKVVYAVNRKKKKAKYEAKGPFQIMETISPGSVFEGSIIVQHPEQPAGKEKIIKTPIKAIELLKASNGFYESLLKEESKIIHEIGASEIVDKKINGAYKDLLNQTFFLTRLGRHSGAEAVTIEGNRKIKITQKRGQYKFDDHATTLWLASDAGKPSINNGLIPFGWAMLEVL